MVHLNLILVISLPNAPVTCLKRNGVKSSTSAMFIGEFDQSCKNFTADTSPEILVDQFNSLCVAILKKIAPFKIKRKTGPIGTPWLNDYTHKLKRECSWAREPKWKHSRLEVNLAQLKKSNLQLQFCCLNCKKKLLLQYYF